MSSMTAQPSVAGTDDVIWLRQKRAALTVAMLGFAVVALDAQITNVALPAIRQHLGGGLSGLQWVVTGYTLMFSALLLALAALARAADSPRRGARFDTPGQVAAVLALGGLTYGCIEGGSMGFGAAPVITAFAVAVAAFATCLADSRADHERHRISPA